jgi:hypothetical protein
MFEVRNASKLFINLAGISSLKGRLKIAHQFIGG